MHACCELFRARQLNPSGSHSNLFSNVDMGAGTRPFASGGAENRGAHSGANNTFWNLYGDKQLALPPCDYGPLLTFVGDFGAVKGEPWAQHWRGLCCAAPPVSQLQGAALDATSHV